MDDLSKKVLAATTAAAGEQGWKDDPYGLVHPLNFCGDAPSNHGTGNAPLTKAETAEAAALGTVVALREAGMIKQ